MTLWTIVYKKINILPIDRPFLAYWKTHICIVQFEPQLNQFVCAAFPAEHIHMIQLRPRDLNDITHWMELPRAPLREAKTGDTRKANYAKYNSGKDHDEKEESLQENAQSR